MRFRKVQKVQPDPCFPERTWPAIPWEQISGFRNILVHNYLGEIDAQTVRDVVQRHLSPLQEAVRSMLAEQPK